MTRSPLTFRPEQRLHTPADYEAVFSHKHSAGDAVLLVFVQLRNEGLTRLGTSVSKKCGNSVVRHAIKRSIREAFRHLQHDLPPAVDVVVIPRPGVSPSTAQVLASLPRLIDKALKKARRAAPPGAVTHSEPTPPPNEAATPQTDR